MRVLVLVLATLSALVAATPAVAADGDLEPNYGTDAEFPGFGFYLNPYGSTFNAHLETLRRAPNGQLYLIGSMMDDVTGDPHHDTVDRLRHDPSLREDQRSRVVAAILSAGRG